MGAIASALFVGWEIFTFSSYGASHFAEGIRHVGELASVSPLHWGGALLGLLGSSAIGAGLLALVALGVSRGLIALFGSLATAGLAGLAALPGAPIAGGHALFPAWQTEMWIFAPLGLAAASAVGALTWREARSLGAARHDSLEARQRRFLLLWLGIEVAGFFLVSPFPALRRVIGVQVAACLLIAGALSRCETRGALYPVVAWSAALGLLFAVSEVSDARTRVEVLDRAIARLDAEPAISETATRWYVGHWGFQFYAERHGLRAIVPSVSKLLPGDVVVWPVGVYQQRLRVPRSSLAWIDGVSGSNPWPWSTLPWAYSGYPPLRPQPDTQLSVRLLRVVEPAAAR